MASRPFRFLRKCGCKFDMGRGMGAFIYALSADENSPALAASRHTITALFSCRFKCPCPPRRQRHFHGNADRAYNTLHFASQSRVPNGGFAPFGNPRKKRRYATPPWDEYLLFLLLALRLAEESCPHQRVIYQIRG